MRKYKKAEGAKSPANRNIKRITISLPVDIFDNISERAARSEMSMSNYIRLRLSLVKGVDNGSR